MNHLKTFLAGNNFFCFPKILLTSIKSLTENTTTMQLNHRQTQNTIPSPIETFTTNTKNKLKLHEFNIPIRPLINNMKAPTYKIAKHLVRMLNKKNLTLNNHYNVVNSTNLTIDLTNRKIKENYKLIIYDIKDVRISMEETLIITKPMLLKEMTHK